MASIGRTRDVQCHRCKGYGHVMRDCPSKRVMVVKDDEEQIGAEDADHYESLIVQRVLSAQMEKVEQNQRHTLFQTKCVIKERSRRLIIDGGSYNNLASSDTTKPHPHPYHIRWLNNSGKVKVTRLV